MHSMTFFIVANVEIQGPHTAQSKIKMGLSEQPSLRTRESSDERYAESCLASLRYCIECSLRICRFVLVVLITRRKEIASTQFSKTRAKMVCSNDAFSNDFKHADCGLWLPFMPSS